MSGPPAAQRGIIVRDALPADLQAIQSIYAHHVLTGLASFEEVAYLLLHDDLPNASQLGAFKAELTRLSIPPREVYEVLKLIPPKTDMMDVLRTGCSALGAVLPEHPDHKVAEARNVADRLMACFGSMLLYWYHFANSGRRIETQTDDDSIGGHFLHLLHGREPSKSWVDAMHVSLNLYAEHEFNASTFTGRVIAGTGADIYSAITGAIGALRGQPNRGRSRSSAMMAAS